MTFTIGNRFGMESTNGRLSDAIPSVAHSKSTGHLTSGSTTIEHWRREGGLTPWDLAQLVGADRATVTRALEAMNRRGWIQISGPQIVLSLDHVQRRAAAG